MCAPVSPGCVVKYAANSRECDDADKASSSDDDVRHLLVRRDDQVFHLADLLARIVVDGFAHQRLLDAPAHGNSGRLGDAGVDRGRSARNLRRSRGRTAKCAGKSQRGPGRVDSFVFMIQILLWVVPMCLGGPMAPSDPLYGVREELSVRHRTRFADCRDGAAQRCLRSIESTGLCSRHE